MKKEPTVSQMTSTTATNPEVGEARQEANARGIEIGWRASNLSVNDRTPYSPVDFVQFAAEQAAARYGAGTGEFWGFVHGYAEGVERHQADEWQDGEPRHPEPEGVEALEADSINTL